MKNAFLITFAIFLTLAGCGTMTSNGDRHVTAVTEPVQTAAASELAATASSIALQELELLTPANVVAVPGEVEEILPDGDIDWSGNTVRAVGTGVVDTGNPNSAQALLMAERAAVVVAQRNLLELVKGVRVDSETRVENFMTDYDVIYTRVQGIVRNARQIGSARYDSIAGVVEVELEMEIHSPQGLSGALSSALGGTDISEVSMSPQTREFLEQYSGLVIDGGQAGLQPSMYPKIYDENGMLLLDTKNYASCLGSGGQAAMQFISDLDRILDQPEFARSPLVLNVRQITGQLGTDIILSSTDTGKLGWLKDGLPFLLSAGRFLLRVIM